MILMSRYELKELKNTVNYLKKNMNRILHIKIWFKKRKTKILFMTSKIHEIKWRRKRRIKSNL